ncbi:NUDIX hydrolase [Bacillus solitudinis]|uniref:NUDIX hydrolase n=1 Tax=Bacillus solitudinis TaxID=2014074 RepID=UPI001D0D71D0|nr:CoA pyrophosphatase [Bacillus solitudinis]
MKHITQLQGRSPRILGEQNQRHSAVILPIVEHNNELNILFEVRALSLHQQPGEICFPGGRIDETDPSPQAAAVRELTEEIGIPASDFEIIAPLDTVVTPFRGIIHPFVAHIHDLAMLNSNLSEVDHVFMVPLSYLHTHQPERYDMQVEYQPSSDFPFELIANKDRYKKRVDSFVEYFYHYEQYVIWGLTARILHHFLQLTKPR